MNKITKNEKKLKWSWYKGWVLAIIVSAFFLPSYMKIEKTGDTIFDVFLNGVMVGSVTGRDVVDGCVRSARLAIARERDDMVMIDADVSVEGREVLFGKVDDADTVTNNMIQEMKDSERQTLHRSYTVKVNEFTVNLAKSEEVLSLLNAVLDKYDTKNAYTAQLVLDPTRELNVLTTQIMNEKEEAGEETESYVRKAGAEAYFENAFASLEPEEERDFEDYELGLVDLRYGDTVEVVEAYLPQRDLTPLEDAIAQLTKEQEKNKIYEVASGDTLSQIAEDNGLTMDRLVEMNATIDGVDSLIRVGDEIIVTSPEPELSVVRQEEMYYEENYDAEVVYVDNDEWYTTDQVTRQEPSAGFRKVVAIVTYRNDAETGEEIMKEEVVLEAVPKIVERGTKIPPTYIKPISGGRLSSNFGRRSAPTRGASTYHKGIDWATPVGTSVVASSGGTVTRAGWGSGYGYVVYIDHGDGRQTRYGHLSKVLVKAGQTVTQGQKIALSGNTGRSTGPHVHFEILINGAQVNPMQYLS